MTTITYLTGDATLVPPYSIIAHICNNKGGWGVGGDRADDSAGVVREGCGSDGVSYQSEN